MSTNLIDTYVSEVGRRLSSKSRADIEAEIRSILQDMLDERSQKTGKPVDEETILEVLKAYGSPEKVAGTYLGDRYLIGPRLYPTFILVLRILLPVIGILGAIGLGIAIYPAIGNAQNAFETIVRGVANLGVALIIALGNVVLIFAILEWALFRAGAKIDVKGLPKEKEWDPRSLTKLSTLQPGQNGRSHCRNPCLFRCHCYLQFLPGDHRVRIWNGWSMVHRRGKLDVYPPAVASLLLLRPLLNPGLVADHHPGYSSATNWSLEHCSANYLDRVESYQHYDCSSYACWPVVACYHSGNFDNHPWQC